MFFFYKFSYNINKIIKLKNNMKNKNNKNNQSSSSLLL